MSTEEFNQNDFTKGFVKMYNALTLRGDIVSDIQFLLDIGKKATYASTFSRIINAKRNAPLPLITAFCKKFKIETKDLLDDSFDLSKIAKPGAAKEHPPPVEILQKEIEYLKEINQLLEKNNKLLEKQSKDHNEIIDRAKIIDNIFTSALSKRTTLESLQELINSVYSDITLSPTV